MLTGQGTAAFAATTFYWRTTLLWPLSGKLLNQELQLLWPWLRLGSQEVRDQLGIRAMFPNPGCTSESPGVLYHRIGTCLAPTELYLIDLEQVPPTVLKAKRKTCGCCSCKVKVENHCWSTSMTAVVNNQMAPLPCFQEASVSAASPELEDGSAWRFCMKVQRSVDCEA